MVYSLKAGERVSLFIDIDRTNNNLISKEKRMKTLEETLAELNLQENNSLRTVVNAEDKFYCKLCRETLKIYQLASIKNHCKAEKHVRRRNLRAVRDDSLADPNKDVAFELCEAMVATDMPWHKIEIPEFRNFLQLNIAKKMPSDETLRTTCLDKMYNIAIASMKQELSSGPVWISVDGTTDSCGRPVANVILGKLDKTQFHKPYLANCEFLDGPENSKRVAKLIQDTLPMYNIKPAELKLMVSDAASYMLVAGWTIKNQCNLKMIHVTCIVHGLHRVCETIRVLFPLADKWIFAIKKIFKKSPLRVMAFKQKNPNLALPPQPVSTRWGTFLEAAIYHNDNYKAVCKVVKELDSEDAASIKEAQELMNDSALEMELKFIAKHLTFFIYTIKALETQGMTLSAQLKLYEDAKMQMKAIPGDYGENLRSKFNKVEERNPGIQQLIEVRDLQKNWPGGYTPLIDCLKYANTVSVDCER